VYVHGNVIRTK